ncbi:MAG: hypothetical protein Q9225_004186, partial [Loekoesia sp. 1 TL-2023]
MFPSFTGSARRPRQVNLSGRNSNPFAANAASRQSPSAQTTQNTVAHAQAERILRQQERRRPPAATAIQRSWRGYRDRKQTKNAWRRDWDAREEADLTSGPVRTAEGSGLIPYRSQTDCLSQLKLLLHFASPQQSSDQNRLRHFAQRFRGLHLAWNGGKYPPEVWIFPLLRLARLTISTLNQAEPSTSSENVDLLLELLSTLANDIPRHMALYSVQYFEALSRLQRSRGEGWTARNHDKKLFNESIAALLHPVTDRTINTYEGFASQFLCRADIPLDTLQSILDKTRIEDLTSAVNNLLSPFSPMNLLQNKSSENLLWLVAYFIYIHRSANGLKRRAAAESDAGYVTALSRIISHLAVDIASRIDAPANAAPIQGAASTSSPSTSSSRPSLPTFVRSEILSLISQDHVSGLLAQAAASTDAASQVSRSLPSTLAVYALTLLRAFPQRGDEIRMWLYLGSTSRQSGATDSPIPAIKYYYNATSQTSVFKLITDDPNHAINLLNPGAKRRGNTPRTPDGDEQWQVILLFLELYPIVLKVMDDEEFLTGAASTSPNDSWTRQSALALDQVKDLTVFLKNLAFSMYWNASEIAGVEQPENKNSIAEYFSGNLSAISDNHPDAKSTRPRDVTIAGLPGMTMSYMKGMVTGLLRMIYERDSRRRFLPSDHWLMTKWFEMDRFIPAVVQEEEEKHKIQESYGAEPDDHHDDDIDDEVEDEMHDTMIGTQRTQQVRNLERLRRQQRKVSRRKYLESVTPRLEILQNMPFFIPFATRVQIFRHFVLLDQIRRRGTADADMWRFSMMNSGRADMGKHRAKVRRESIFDDAFKQYYDLGEGLKEPIQISFVDKFDTVEEGIDGGGVTKEFLTSVTNEAFNSMSGLDMFVENDQHLLYPNPTALEERKELLRQAGEPEGSSFYNESVRDLLRRFEFMGRIIGKCLYEGILVDIHFAPFFLLKWSLTGGHTSATRESGYRANLNDLRDLDEALYQGLLQLKNLKSDDGENNSIESLALTFEVTDTLFPADRPSSQPSQAPIPRTIELRPNGSNIPVTNANRLVYISYIARHRLSIQPFHQTSAFLKGLGQIIAPAWLSMFNQHELQTLISGSAASIDIADLHRNTEYGGLYMIGNDGFEHPTIQLFWQVVYAFSDEDKMKLLKFVTSTPRAPLLGFGNLNPRFLIRDGGNDEQRLPTT